jgi:hypothetical protein
MTTSNRELIPNQVFIGLPWKNVRPQYDRLIPELEKKYPLYFTIIGRDDGQEASLDRANKPPVAIVPPNQRFERTGNRWAHWATARGLGARGARRITPVRARCPRGGTRTAPPRGRAPAHRNGRDRASATNCTTPGVR